MILRRSLVILIVLVGDISCSSPAMILQKEDNISKSSNDKRQYRTLELENHMKVVLVSDPETDKSAASLSLAVGSMSNPKEIPRLAHFCEHMLLMGTKKYPEENAFQKFISQHGGSFGAQTGPDYTVYYFQIAPDHLKDSLDIFAQFFIDPLFTESAIDREANAVHLENEKNIPNDHRRSHRLFTHLADPDHPFNSFSTGNLDTILKIPKNNGLNIRKALVQFYNKWYSSNLMSLAILGRETLDELEQTVIDLFGKVQDKQIEKPRWDQHPFRNDQFQTFLYKSPMKDIRTLNILFPCDDLSQEYRSMPFIYISYLIGHKGPNSILSSLKERNWATSLSINGGPFARGFGFFDISMDLTRDGLNQTNDIVKIVFQYVNMLKKKGIQKWIQDEITRINEIRFRFKERETPLYYIIELSSRLHNFGMKDILTAGHLITDWKPDLIEKELNYFIPQNIRVVVTAKDFEDDLEEEEPFYKIRYKLIKIPKDVIQDWINAGFSPELDLPPKNEFIATDFDLLPLEMPIQKYPEIIKDTSLSRVWFKQDDKFLVPKADANFLLQSPITYIDSLNSNLAIIFQNLFYNVFTEYIYSAQLAGLELMFYNSQKGFLIGVSGYSSKQHVFLDRIMEKLVNFTVDPEKFEIYRENQLRDLRNIDATEPREQIWEHFTDVLKETRWTAEDLIDVFDEVTIEKMQEYIRHFFSKLHIECLIHGNVNKEKALELVKIVEDRLKSSFQISKVQPRELQPGREVKLSKGHSYIYEIQNKVHKSSCAALYYQVGLQSIENIVKLEMLRQILHEPSFSTLRTKEQLGYVVFTSIRTSNSVQGLLIVVQSDRHPKFLDYRIEAFLNQMKETLSNMSDEEFTKHREALISQHLEKPRVLKSQTSTYWAEILIQHYRFNRVEEEIVYMRKVTKQDILIFFEKHIAANAKDRRKLAIYVNSAAKDRKMKDEDQVLVDKVENGSEIIRIKNLVNFKRSHELYPIILPSSEHFTKPGK